MRIPSRRRAASLDAVNYLEIDFRDKLGGAPDGSPHVQLWLRLAACATVVEKRVRARLEEEFGTTLPRFEVLATIDRHPGNPTMSQLSRSLMVSNGNVTAVVNRLIKDGLVVRAVDGRDGRVAAVQLTRKGRAALARMAEAQERWVADMFGGLDDERLGQLMELLADLRLSVESSDV